MKSVNRTVRPAVRKLTAVIPGRDGVMDFGDDGYEKREITIVLSIRTGRLEDLRQTVRDLAYWLSGSGDLIFSDEPDKAYDAQVVSPIDLDQVSRTGMCQVVFECQPFASALVYSQVLQVVAKAEEEIPLMNIGTQACPCRIIITNIGASSIKDLILTRLSTG